MPTAYLGKLPIGSGHPVRIMGVINASPESFYAGSIADVPERAVELADSWRGFVDLIDVGGMSTAPYKDTWVPAEEELRRVVPVVKALAQHVDVPISVDTYRPKVAEEALRAGASIVNDVTGLKLYPEMCKVVRDYGASLVLMAREREPRPGADPVDRLISALRESVEIALRCGVDPERIVVDPGIGFPTLPPADAPYVMAGEYRHGDPQWPWWKWDLYVIKNLEKIGELGRPVLVGVSRKSFIRRILGAKTPDEVLPGSLAAEALAVAHGANAIRTHNPKESRQAVKIAEALRKLI
ncbi:dihydropteroate synthase [Thermoproteus sp. CP80]|uniref:dihydropteroate synthase n=1 Tax=Thermoproteus sp. CP80 TaxID=1650659 RepID=UPI001EE0EBCC|nr:dihydropteroate synthase [Thermoproteus sp. CP80]